MAKKIGKEGKNPDGSRKIPATLRSELKKARKALGLTDAWEPERVDIVRR